jgi:hypothetical protein
MRGTRLAGRTLRIAACAAVTLLQASTAAGEPLRGKDRRACIGAYEQGQELAQAAKLLRAREVILGCAKSKCGEFLHRECAASYSRLEEEIPTVILLAKGEGGQALVDVEVTMDGELFSATLDGRAVPVDPGLHQFSFKAKRGTTAEQRTIIVQGERNRVIAVSFASADRELPKPPAAPPPRPPSRRIDEEVYAADSARGTRGAAPYVAAGIGLAGLGGFALFTQWGRADNAELARCAPNCSEGTLDHIRTLYVAADVSLGVGIVALGAAAWLFLSDTAKDPKPTKAPAYTFDVRPSHTGVVATLSGKF